MTFGGGAVESATVFQHLLARRWFVIVPTLGFAILGAIFSLIAGPRYESTATLVIQEPGSNAFAGTSSAFSRPERYVADQVAILESDSVAREALDLIRVDVGMAPRLEDFRRARSVEWSSESGVVEVSHRAATPDAAQMGADALVTAYAEIRLEETMRLSASALSTIDDAISAIDSELVAVDQAIVDAAVQDPAMAAIESEYAAAIERVLELRDLARTADVEQLEAIRAEEVELFAFLDVVRVVRTGAREPTEVARLTSLRDALLGQRASLVARRTDLAIDADSVGVANIVFSAARLGSPTRGGALQTTVLALLLGALFGVGLTLVFPSRDVGMRLPQLATRALRAPLIAEIPDYSALPGEYVVRDAPESLAAAEYRRVVAMLQTRVEETRKSVFESVETERPPRDPMGRFVSVTYAKPYAGRSHVVLSAGPGEGRTEIVANLTAAAALESRRVLAIDADFSKAQLTTRLTGSRLVSRGLADIVADGIDLKGAVVEVDLGEGIIFSLLGQGMAGMPPQDLFRSAQARAVFNSVIDAFDLVFIDTPPLYLAAYAGTIARNCDEVSLVIPEGMSRQEIEGFAARIQPLDLRILGWIHNRKPATAARVRK